MNRFNCLKVLGLMCGIGLILSGCLIKPARVPTHYLVLTPIAPTEHVIAAAHPLSVEVGLIKMPSYLLRDSVIVRKSATEIEYLDNVLWAERLDQTFGRALVEDLSSRMPSSQIYLSAPQSDRLMVRVSINVKQFDVDRRGVGALVAEWHLTDPGAKKLLTSGQTRLTRVGASPRANPQVIATTLSVLVSELSQELAQALRQSAPKP